MGKTKTKTSKKTHKTRKLFSPWWLQPTRCQNKCFTSVQGNLLKCNILWCSEVQRDNLRVSFGLNSIHMWFVITTARHSKEGWTLKIGFSKHPCFLQINISQKCSEVAADILSENTTFLPVIHQPTATSGAFVSHFLFSSSLELSEKACPHFFWTFTFCDTWLVFYQNIFASRVRINVSKPSFYKGKSYTLLYIHIYTLLDKRISCAWKHLLQCCKPVWNHQLRQVTVTLWFWTTARK